MNHKRFAVLAGLLLVCGAAGWWLMSAPVTTAPEPVSSVVEQEHQQPAATAGSSGSALVPGSVNHPALPRDERVSDIEVDGQVRLDMNGNLVLDRQLRRYLDFFIGLTGGASHYETLKARLASELKAQDLPPEIQRQVLAILDDYLSYRKAAEAMASNEHHSVDDVRQALGQIHDLRREHLGPDVAEGFFGEEERRLQVMLDRQKILSDESLTASERDRALAQLDQLLPEYSRELRRRSRTVVETAMQVQQLREQGASEAEVRELRLQAYGAEATERLARLDQQRNQWQNRLGEYRQQKALIDNNEGLAPADRQAAVEALRERIFTEEHERRRIRALERTAGLDS